MDTDLAQSLGCIETSRGRLPLAAVSVVAEVWGPTADVTVRQTFVNAFDDAVEATFVFPLPDRAAVQRCSATLGSRVIEARLFERGEAREQYQQAVESGQRAALVEEDRPGCFTTTLGNLQPGEHAVLELRYALELPVSAGEATFRFPLVLAPRFTPGTPLRGASVGQGTAADTTATPDASRVTPPVLLPGSPNPVQLSLEVCVHHAGVAAASLTAPLHEVITTVEPRLTRITLAPRERMDRDFILRYQLFGARQRSQVFTTRDATGDEGTWQLCLLAPEADATAPRDVVFLLDTSGSMDGWKLETARSALVKLVSSLGADDRFALFSFGDVVISPLPSTLSAATRENVGLATRFLEHLVASGNTEVVRALNKAVSMPWARARDKVVVLITDGQVTNEDELVRVVKTLPDVRLCAVGIDQAVNEGLLRRLAELTGGTVELVESAARLAEAIARITRTARTPALANVTVSGLDLLADETTPSRAPSAYAGDTLVLRGRFRGAGQGALEVRGRRPDGTLYEEHVGSVGAEAASLTAVWARARLRSLEDQYVGARAKDELRQTLVATSLRFGVLCRFTAFCAVDREAKVTTSAHRVVQPVEPPRGWASSMTGAPRRAPASQTPQRYGSAAPASRSTKTRAGILKGKFGYMSPEQVRGLPVDPRTEVFVLGIILWEVLSGRRLFVGDSDFSILEAVRAAKLPDTAFEGVGPALEQVLRRALAKDPDHRYANGAALADALDALDVPAAPSLADFVVATCDAQHSQWQQRVARALALTPPDDGSVLLVERLSIGGMNEDWLGVRAGSGGTTELVLTKRLFPTVAEDEEFFESYLEAVSFGAAHPGIIRVLGVNDGRGTVVSAHELVRGVELPQLLRATTKAKTLVPPRLALEIIARVGRALAFMNDLPGDDGAPVGSVHRSLEPSKIILGFDGAVKVAGACAPPAERYRVSLLGLPTSSPPSSPTASPAPVPAVPVVAPDRGLLGRLRSFWK